MKEIIQKPIQILWQSEAYRKETRGKQEEEYHWDCRNSRKKHFEDETHVSVLANQNKHNKWVHHTLTTVSDHCLHHEWQWQWQWQLPLLSQWLHKLLTVDVSEYIIISSLNSGQTIILKSASWVCVISGTNRKNQSQLPVSTQKTCELQNVIGILSFKLQQACESKLHSFQLAPCIRKAKLRHQEPDIQDIGWRPPAPWTYPWSTTGETRRKGQVPICARAILQKVWLAAFARWFNTLT